MIMEIISAHLDEPPFDSFAIIDSEKEKGDIFVSPDIAVCEKCKVELFDKQTEDISTLYKLYSVRSKAHYYGLYAL